MKILLVMLVLFLLVPRGQGGPRKSEESEQAALTRAANKWRM